MIDIDFVLKSKIREVELFGDKLPFLFTTGSILLYCKSKRITLDAIMSDVSETIPFFYFALEEGCKIKKVNNPFKTFQMFSLSLEGKDIERISDAFEESIPTDDNAEENTTEENTTGGSGKK